MNYSTKECSLSQCKPTVRQCLQANQYIVTNNHIQYIDFSKRSQQASHGHL